MGGYGSRSRISLYLVCRLRRRTDESGDKRSVAVPSLGCHCVCVFRDALQPLSTTTGGVSALQHPDTTACLPQRPGMRLCRDAHATVADRKDRFSPGKNTRDGNTVVRPRHGSYLKLIVAG